MYIADVTTQVFALELLIHQTFLTCTDPALRKQMAQCIRRGRHTYGKVYEGGKRLQISDL